MNLIIDIGNTRTKIALFKNKAIEKIEIIETMAFHVDQLSPILNLYKPGYAIISSVTNLSETVSDYLKQNLALVMLDHNVLLPFTNKYETFETLGKDRIANAAAAVTLFPSNNVLVIDAGTCITYDFVNDKKEYR